MPYEKHTWETGETITAEKLNHMEDGIADSDKGYDYSLIKTDLFSETINSTYNNGYYVATFSYSQIFDNDELIVVFDDVEYFCNKNVVYGQSIYGGFNESGPTFTDFPFVINSSQSSGNTILTSTGGTHTTNNQLIFTIYPYMETNEVDSSDLQAYCQEPHHLKIEWFII